MTLKLPSIKNDIPRSHRFAHAGSDFFKAYKVLKEHQGGYFCSTAVTLPILHMSIELFLKAHASQVESSFNPNDPEYKHNTVAIVIDFEKKVDCFKDIMSEPKEMELLKVLEEAWIKVRYGESGIFGAFESIELAENIALKLGNAYHEKWRIPLFSEHFKST